MRRNAFLGAKDDLVRIYGRVHVKKTPKFLTIKGRLIACPYNIICEKNRYLTTIFLPPTI